MKAAAGAVGIAVLGAIAAALITPDTLPRWWHWGVGLLDEAQFETRRRIASLIFPQATRQTPAVDEKQALASMETYKTAREQFDKTSAENLFLAHAAGTAVTWVGFVSDVGSERNNALIISARPHTEELDLVGEKGEHVICRMGKDEWTSARSMLGERPMRVKVEFAGTLSVSTSYDLAELERCSVKRVLAH